MSPVRSFPKGNEHGDDFDESEGTEAVGGVWAGEGGGFDAGGGGRTAGVELSPDEAGLGAVLSPGGCGPSAWLAWPGFQSAGAGRDEAAGCGVVSRAVRRLWSDAGGGVPGQERRGGRDGDDAAALAITGRAAGAPSQAAPASSSLAASGAAWRFGADRPPVRITIGSRFAACRRC